MGRTIKQEKETHSIKAFAPAYTGALASPNLGDCGHQCAMHFMKPADENMLGRGVAFPGVKRSMEASHQSP